MQVNNNENPEETSERIEKESISKAEMDESKIDNLDNKELVISEKELFDPDKEFPLLESKIIFNFNTVQLFFGEEGIKYKILIFNKFNRTKSFYLTSIDIIDNKKADDSSKFMDENFLITHINHTDIDIDSYYVNINLKKLLV